MHGPNQGLQGYTWYRLEVHLGEHAWEIFANLAPFLQPVHHIRCPYHLDSDLNLIILELDVPFPLLKDSLIEIEDRLIIL